MADMDPGLRLREILLKLVRRLNNLERLDAACCGMTVGQCRVLWVIAKRGPTTPGEVAETLGVDASTVTKLVDSLADGGLVQRQPAATDRRHVLLSLTPSGLQTWQEMEPAVARRWQAILATVPPHGRLQLVSWLQAVAEALERQCGDAPVGKEDESAKNEQR